MADQIGLDQIGLIGLQEELSLKEQRSSFWETHHRLMPEQRKLFYGLVSDDLLDGPAQGFQYLQ